MGINPFLLYNLKYSKIYFVFRTTPTQAPLMKTFVEIDKYYVEHSSNKFIPLPRNHPINGYPDVPLLI